VRALAEGNLGAFFDLQPVYGSFSGLVQAPFAAIALHLGDGSDLLLYRLVLFPCLLAVGLLGTYLAHVMAERGQPALVCMAAAVFVLVNPATLAAVELGHPEELLTGALVVGAALTGLRQRRLASAVLLGLAVSTKQWALLAVVPVLLSWEGGTRTRIRLAVTAGAVAGALILPLALTSPDRFSTNTKMAQGGTPIVSRFSVWWPVSSARKEMVTVGNETSAVVRHRMPRGVTGVARPLIVMFAVLLALLYARLRQGRRGEDLIALLALVLLLRCLFDPLNNAYYHVPVLLSLLAWEGMRFAGLPALTLLSAAALWASFEHFMLVEPALNNLFYLGWALMLAGWLALSLYAPGLLGDMRRRFALGKRLALPAGRPSLPARNM
jgi:glycosyl transferase family 87